MNAFRLAACLLLAGTAPAAADTVWTLWERDGEKVGTIYTDAQSATHQIYVVEGLPVRLYVEFKPQDASPGTISGGYYVDYSETAQPCPQGPATDHLGQKVPSWGYLEHAHDPQGSEDFYLRTGTCDGPIDRDFIARW